MRLVWDLETDNLLHKVTKIHSLLMKDVDTGLVYSLHTGNDEHPPSNMSIDEGLEILSKAEERIGHNILAFDLQVIKKLYPNLVMPGVDTDTMVQARLLHPDIKTEDNNALRLGTLNKDTFKAHGKSLFGSHKLAAWGFRIGEHKTEYTGGFDKWSPEMQAYGEQDIETTHKLWLYLKPDFKPSASTVLEHDIAAITSQMERDGIPFDMEKAIALQADLVKQRDDIKLSLMGLFPSWQTEYKRFIAKSNNKKLGRVKGDEVVVYKTHTFNPGSRDHISKCLMEKYKWKPREHTPTGKPMINDEILRGLKYPEAQRLADYFKVCKTLSQLAEGEENWMQHCKDGVIHARYNTMGCVTSRCSHSSPNIGQVPAISLDKETKLPVFGLGGGFGVECRALFGTAPSGYALLGSDMSGLELRCLAHYMAVFDGGAYAQLVTTGDVHTVNQEAAGLPKREDAKTMIYLTIYGGGAEALSTAIGVPIASARRMINAFKNNTLGYSALENTVQAVASKGYLTGIDGRKVPVRKAHAALNSLLQSCGAIICKRWVVGVRKSLEASGLIYGMDYRFVAFIHDELQILVKTEHQELVGSTCKQVAVQVGVDLKLNCPLAAEYKVGKNWSETH